MFRLTLEFSRLDVQNPEQVSKTLLWIFPGKVYTSMETTTRSGVLQPPVLRKMEWTRDIIFRFIELYRAHPLLWDPRNEHHKMKNKNSDAWTEISNCLNVEKGRSDEKNADLVVLQQGGKKSSIF